MLEKYFAEQVEHLLNLYGWRWTHFEPAIRQSGGWATALRGMKGLPDYVAVRDGALVFAEIKSDRGKLTPDQAEWITRLQGVQTVRTEIWYPEDLPEIKQILGRGGR
jgi:hypothetical protein